MNYTEIKSARREGSDLSERDFVLAQDHQESEVTDSAIALAQASGAYHAALAGNLDYDIIRARSRATDEARQKLNHDIERLSKIVNWNAKAGFNPEILPIDEPIPSSRLQTVVEPSSFVEVTENQPTANSSASTEHRVCFNCGFGTFTAEGAECSVCGHTD